MSTVTVQGLVKSFASGRGQVTALAGLSFALASGGCAMVLGKSGSGKSTLLNCLGALERPDAGRVWIDAVDIHALSAAALARFQRRQVGFVFQSGNLLSYLTVRENLKLPLALNGLFGRRARKRVVDMLAAVDLPGFEAALPRELSGGEIQRVALARALVHRPALLLADEPTASLDSASAALVAKLMRDLGRQGRCTLIVTTHDEQLTAHADIVLHLTDGQLENMP